MSENVSPELEPAKELAPQAPPEISVATAVALGEVVLEPPHGLLRRDPNEPRILW